MVVRDIAFYRAFPEYDLAIDELEARKAAHTERSLPELEFELGKAAYWLATDAVWFPLWLAYIINPGIVLSDETAA